MSSSVADFSGAAGAAGEGGAGGEDAGGVDADAFGGPAGAAFFLGAVRFTFATAAAAAGVSNFGALVSLTLSV